MHKELTDDASASSGQQVALRYTFVEMLFALASAEVAVVASNLIRADGAVVAKLAVTAHLVLATIVIATSWLGWSMSRWRRERTPIDGVLSLNFLGLLLDVLLVILYFILVRSAKLSDSTPYKVEPADATLDARLLVWIFIVYVVWDVVSDVLKETNKPRTFGPLAGLTVASTLCSVACTVLVYIVLRRADPVYSIGGVMSLDVSLLAIVLAFRVCKAVIENSLRRNFVALRSFAAFRVNRPGGKHDELSLIVLLGMYAVGLVMSYLI